MAEPSQNAPKPPALLLRDAPDWLYLLQEFKALYTHGSAGGSTLIRAHRRKVRETLSALMNANPAIVPRAAEAKPVTAHLPRALDLGERSAVHRMARSIRHVSDRLTWEYGYEAMSTSLARKYAYCEVLGPRGVVRSDALKLGLVLFAPDTIYPQHAHTDIEESYISICGSWSENDSAVYAPGSLILNRSNHEHRITTDKNDPCLLTYAWIGPARRLETYDLKFSPRGRKDGN